MALGLTITTVGRDDLALAVSQSDSLTLSNIILTNAATTGTASSIRTASDLAGTLVATMSANGRKIGTGRVQVEGSDNGNTAYEAKTLALVYTKDNETRVFAYYTSGTTFIYKVSDTAVMVSAAIAIEDSQASAITFSNVTLTFPTATTTNKGSVKLASSANILNPPAVDVGNPIVPEAQTVATALTSILGSNCLSDKTIDVKKTLNVGMQDTTTDSYPVSEFTASGNYYDANYHGGTSIDITAFTRGNASWSIGSLNGTFALLDVVGLYTAVALVGSDNNQYGIIMRNNSNAYYIRLLSQPSAALSLKTVPTDTKATIARTVDAHTVKASIADAGSIKAGGAEVISFTSSDFYQSDTSGLYRLKTLLYINFVRGSEITIPALYIGGTAVTGSVLSNYDRTWTKNGRTYTYSYNTHVFSCTGGTPEAGSITFNSSGEVSCYGPVKTYGVDLSRTAMLGYAKLLLTKTSSGFTYSSVDLYNVTVSATTSDNSMLQFKYTGPKLSGDSMFVEFSCGKQVLTPETSVTTFSCLKATNSSLTSVISLTSSATFSSIPLFVKFY